METPNVLAILESEINTLSELLDLLRTQQQYMITGQVEEMAHAVSAQESIITRLKTLEQQRITETTAQISNTARFKKIRATMRSLTDRVQRVNRQNNRLIHRSLSLIRQQIDLFVGPEIQSGLYTGTGESAGPVRRQLLNAKI